MKKIISLIVIASAIGFAQNFPDSSKKKEMNREQNQIQIQQKEMNRLQERIGLKENPEDEKNLNRPKMDVFIDKDGDGICDYRQSGMSFNKMRNRRNLGGQKGPGGLHGSGNGSQMQNGYHGGK